MPDSQSIPVPNEVKQKIGIDLFNVPDVDEFKHLILFPLIFSLNGLKQKLSLVSLHTTCRKFFV